MMTWLTLVCVLLTSLPVRLESLTTYNNYLKIVVLDTEDDKVVDTSPNFYNLTGRTTRRYAVVQWQKVTTNPDEIHDASPVSKPPIDVLLVTQNMCENPFILETVIPHTVDILCVAPNGVITPVDKPCSSRDVGRRRRSLLNSKSFFCLYRHDKMKKIKSVASVVHHLGWTNLIIIHNNGTEFEAKSLIDTMPRKIVLTQYNVDLLRNQTRVLYNLVHQIYTTTNYEDRNILLVCSQSCINRIIAQANTFDTKNKGATAMGVFSKWLVVDFNSRTVLNNPCDLKIDNVAVINFPFTDVTTSLLKTSLIQSLQGTINGVIDEYLDMDIYNVTEFVQEALLHELRNATDCWKAEIFTLLWKPKDRLLSPVGHVGPSEKVDLFDDVIIFPNTKFGFNKRVFLTTTNEWKPFTRRLEKVNGTVKFEGYSFDYLDVIAAALNFTYVLTEPEDGDWGIIKNGSWTGVVGQLHRREADLFAGPLAMSSDREDVVDFTFPYFHVYTSVIFRRPDPNKTKWRKLIDPFKWEVHVCIFASFFCIVILLYSIERLNPYYNVQHDERPTIQGLVLYLFGALLAQGGSSMPSSIAGRSLLASWWIFCLITVATYSGNLIAFLTVSKEKLPFETLEELGNQEDFSWGTLGGSIWVSLIKESNLTVFKKLWAGLNEFNKSDPRVFSLDQEVHKEKVIEEDYGFIADKTTAETWIFENCQLTDLKELFFPMNYAFALQNNSPYLQYFNDEVMKIYESGLGQTIKRKWWPKQNICLEPATVAKRINLVDLQSAFYVIGIGIFIAFVSVLVERCFTRAETGRHIFKFKFLRMLFVKKKRVDERYG